MTELNFIDFDCPHCRSENCFPEDYAGIIQECPNCHETVVVPADGSKVGGVVPLPIDTPRLILRRFHPRDWKDLLEYVAEETLFRYVDGHPLGEEEVLNWLEREAHVKLSTPDQIFHLGLELKEGNKLIGHLTLNLTHQHALQGVVNAFVSPQYQRQRFAGEALAALLNFCFQAIGLHRVAAWCDARNEAACRLFAGAGMRPEAKYLKDRYIHGEWVDTVWFGLLAEEFRSREPS